MNLIADISGERLDAFLARTVPELTRSAAQKLLEEGWFGSEGDIVFVHTGGAAALFAIDLPH